MCYDAFRNVEGTSPRQIIYGYLAAVIFLLACEKFVESEDFDTGIEVLTLVFVTIYGVLLYLYRTRKRRTDEAGAGDSGAGVRSGGAEHQYI